MKVLEKLVSLADRLNQKGLYTEAGMVDRVILALDARLSVAVQFANLVSVMFHSIEPLVRAKKLQEAAMKFKELKPDPIHRNQFDAVIKKMNLGRLNLWDHGLIDAIGAALDSDSPDVEQKIAAAKKRLKNAISQIKYHLESEGKK